MPLNTVPHAAHAPLTIDPPPGEWTLAPRHTPRHAALRRELALPTDRPVVMTGHQPGLWHPGILAKYLAAEAAAAALGAAPAHLVVDQDDHPDPLRPAFPHQTPDGRLKRLTIDLAPDTPRPPGVALARLPAARITRDPPRELPASLRPALDALARHENAPSIAHQTHRAATDLLADFLPPAPTVHALDLARTDAFRAWVDRMRTDPRACRTAYNDAARRHPRARIRPLRTRAGKGAGDHELPLWHVPRAADTPRRPVFARDLDAIPPEELAPRALAMTGFLRAHACDLFIHGTGGRAYDAITDDWLQAWLGPAPLAPAVVVTATRRLPLADNLPNPEDAARAAWHAHHARHNPALLGDHNTDARKRRLAEQIAATPRDDTARRRALFDDLHALLAAAQADHADRLDALNDNAADLRRRSRDAAVAHDRTWPFPLYPADTLRNLANEIRAAFTT